MKITALKFAGFLSLVGWMLAVSPAAEAHYLWIETAKPTDKTETAKFEVYFGEYEESLREIAGGRLDEVTAIEANPQIEFSKKANHFEGSVRSSSLPGSAIVQLQELGRPVADLRKYDISIVKPNYYASAFSGKGLEPKEPEYKTTLGVYPVSLGKETIVKVFFKGEILPGAKVNVHAPNGWSKEFKTDETGTARFTPLWPGQYVAEVIHAEKTPGEFKGTAYEAVRHRATFTWNHES